MASQDKPHGIIARHVRKNSDEYREYLSARFPRFGGAPSPFDFDGHKWKYHATSFDDLGEYDILHRPEMSLAGASQQVPLYREIDALGGVGEGERHDGYSAALTDVLAILTKRGFTEHAAPTAPENPAAFPCSPGDVPFWNEGMTLRDYFAGQALIGAALEMSKHDETLVDCAVGMARAAYVVADAMLAARQAAA